MSFSRQIHRAESSGPGVQAQIGGKISGQKLKMKFLVSYGLQGVVEDKCCKATVFENCLSI